MQVPPNLTLGVDLGTNSVGWALIAQNDGGQPIGILRSGVRIFQEAVEAKTRTPKNQQRRQARSARKVIARRKMRREALLRLFQKAGMLPTDGVELTRLFQDPACDPYELRVRGLDVELSLHEFGRALYHLNKRRGFQSNRKADTKEKDDKKLSDYKQAMKSLAADIASGGYRTLGEYLYVQSKRREKHTTRQMYEEEFRLLWEKQAAFRPDTYKPELRARIFKFIFFQRPLKVQAFLIGKCTLEPKRPRAARALLAAQRFRIWQDLNHLEVNGRKLSLEDRQRLFDRLDRGESMTWLKAKQLLGMHKNEVFNLEGGKKDRLPFNITAAKIGKALGEAWAGLSEREQHTLVEDMLTIDHEGGFLRRMKQYWRFDDATAQRLLEVELERGYARLSRKAITNILPHLEQGMRYDEACAAAGYDHSNQRSSDAREMLEDPPDVRNPVVQKTLWETKRVVNALIREYGKPSLIRVEMARDMKMSRKQREEYQREQKRREAENEKARVLFQEHTGGAEASRDDIIRYRLWQESEKMCPYTGQMISEAMLFSGQVDVEHILPYSRCLDDSYMNRTLCMAEENRNIKRNRSPYEAYATTPERYEQILVRLRTFRSMPEAKKRRFAQQEIQIDDFIERQLNDTRYICREVKDYLRQLGVPVQVSKGGATADLRYLWGLNRVLNPDDRNSKVREDHRHHAIDAIVIALTDRCLFQMLSDLSQRSNGASLKERGFHLPLPWPGCLNDVRRSVEAINVSHAASHKVSGALHEETAYGLASTPDSKGYATFVVRKPLDSFSERKQLEAIRDPEIRRLALARLDECGYDPRQAFGNLERPLLHKDGKTRIVSVRVISNFDTERMIGIRDSQSKPYKYFPMGSNHHVEILESRDGKKWRGVFVSTIEAARRAKANQPVFLKDHGPEWAYVMSLCINDMVELDVDGARRLYRVQKMSDPNVDFRLHAASVLKLEQREGETAEAFNARQAAYDKATHVRSSVNPLKAKHPRKVAITPLGDIREPYD